VASEWRERGNPAVRTSRIVREGEGFVLRSHQEGDENFSRV
jgi:hypothetical protein